VFTPFSRAWKALPDSGSRTTIPAPVQIKTPPGIFTLRIPQEPALPASVPFPPGEGEAQRRLHAFINRAELGIYHYKDLRDREDIEGTSKLSPYLRFGLLSARQVVSAAWEAIRAAPDEQSHKNAETWLNELIWREFYIHILYHFPEVRKSNFRMHNIAWNNDAAEFAAWCAGLTGYPGVDAAMRQLVKTGWMHNRARMIVASFLTKDLLIDWRWGERFFMQHLVDGDPAANNGGWQWTAGTGTDAAPYFRIFNPILQSKKFDPNGQYIRQWVPELTSVPNEFIHEPWLMPDALQKSIGCVIGKNYPAPLVDHHWARERTLNAYNNQ
jgi:deoxyribodipyrimidine photo-lyase